MIIRFAMRCDGKAGPHEHMPEVESRYNRVWIAVIAALLTGWLVMGAGNPVAVAGQPVVSDVRVGVDGARTRLVLELSEPVIATVFTLDGPARVVIDLPEVGWRLPQKPLPGNEGLMARMRYGLFKPGTTRIVLDLTRDAVVDDAFLLEPSEGSPYRFVLDIKPETSAAFRASVAGPGRSVTTAVDPATLSPRSQPEAPPVMNAAVSRPSLPPLVRAVAGPFPVPPRKPGYAGRRHVVVIDPGHGGADPGAKSIRGVYEKHITLAAARALKEELEHSGRYEVVLTRNRDVFISLHDRVTFAHEAGGELFVSLHADAIDDRRIRGLSVYTLSQKASDNLAEQLAVSENKADLIGGIDLSHESREVTNILIDLAQRETMNQSVRFAGLVVNELRQEVKLLRNSHRFAGFAVLKSADMPSVLVELGFLSNDGEEKNLRTKEYRKKLANSIAQAIDRYFVRVEEAYRP